MTETNISILVADDSPFIRTAYQRILETQENFNIVSIVENGLQAVEKALELTPDVIVIDIRMPELDGISASHKIRKSLPETSIVVVSAYDDWSYVFDLIQKNPDGKAYLLKNSLDDVGELIRVVELVNQRHLVLDHALAAKLEEYHERHPSGGTGKLDSREVKVLSLLAEGYVGQEISSVLQIDPGDLKEVQSSAYNKLGVNAIDTVQAQVQAIMSFLNTCVSV